MAIQKAGPLPQVNLTLYAEGWTQGDGTKILAAAHLRYVFYEGDRRIPRLEFADYFTRFKASTKPFSDSEFMHIDAVAVLEHRSQLVVSARWRTGDLTGTGVIVVGNRGVLVEKVALA